MTRPNQWTRMHTSGGKFVLSVCIEGNHADFAFEGRDLRDLAKHVAVAVAQATEAEGRVK